MCSVLPEEPTPQLGCTVEPCLRTISRCTARDTPLCGVSSEHVCLPLESLLLFL